MPVRRLARYSVCHMQPGEHLRERLGAVHAVFRALVQTVLPETAGLNGDEWKRMEALVSGALEFRSEHEIGQLRQFLRLIEWGAVLRHGRRFTSLDFPRRERFLRSLQDHPVQLIRSGFWGVRTLAFLGYYGRPEAAAALGYEPEAKGWERYR